VLRWIDDALIAPNPVVWLLRASQGGSPQWDDWAIVVAVHAALSILFIVLSIVQLRKAALLSDEAAPGWQLVPGPRLLRPRLGGQPLLWKELFTHPPVAGLERLIRIVMAIIGWGALGWMLWAWAVTVTSPKPGGGRTPFQVFATLVEPPLLCIALLGVLVRAATCVSREREWGTWDSLLLTPLRPGEIIAGKLLGCLFSMRWVWGLVGLLWVLGVISGQLGSASLAGTAVLVGVLALCAAAVGLLLSLHLRSSLWALTVAVGLSLVLGGGYLLGILPLLTPLAGTSEPPFWLLAPCVPYLLVASLLLGVGDQPNASQLLTTCCLGGALYAVAGLAALRRVWRRLEPRTGRGPSSGWGGRGP
jgi:hypothetical protein